MRNAPPYNIALVYTGLKEKDEAFAWLQRAYEGREPLLVYYLKTEPMLESLRSDPRFHELMGKIGLTP